MSQLTHFQVDLVVFDRLMGYIPERLSILDAVIHVRIVANGGRLILHFLSRLLAGSLLGS